MAAQSSNSQDMVERAAKRKSLRRRVTGESLPPPSEYSALVEASNRNRPFLLSQSAPIISQDLLRRRTSAFIFEPELTFSTLALASKASNGQNVGADGITIGEAVVVQFLSAMGAGIALVAWYPKLCGYMLFPWAVVIVAFTATVSSAAVMSFSVRTGSSTFSELCDGLPSWMKLLSEVCTVAWYLVFLALYVQLTHSSINDQVFAPLGPGPWPWGRAEPGAGNFELYCAVGAAIFVSTTPTTFSGPTARVLNVVNLAATWVTVVMAVLKGIVVALHVRDAAAEDDVQQPATIAVRPEGFIQVIVLLAGAMCCPATMPMLNSELRSDCRDRAIWRVPGLVAILQGTVFLAIGLIGYSALGNSIEGDAFKMYAALHPDWMTTVLQFGITTLLYCSTPLIMLPAKSQIWAFITRALSIDDDDGIEFAPPLARHSLNLALVIVCVSLPYKLGESKFLVLVTVLSGTAAVWNNFCLPGFVLIYMRILPKREVGRPWWRSALVATWVFLLAIAAIVNACFDIMSLL